MKLLSIKSTLPKFVCNDCGIPKYAWQFHWRIAGIQRMEVCKTCRNLVNQKGNNKMSTEQITMSDAQKLLDTYTDEESKFPFGKFKSQTIEEVPNYYLEWFLDATFDHDRYDYLIVPVEKELVYRKTFDVYINGEE